LPVAGGRPGVRERVPARHAVADGVRQLIDHDRDALAVELGLDHAALSPPGLALAHRRLHRYREILQVG